MHLEQVLDQCIDLIQRQFSRGVGIKHGGVVNMLLLAGQDGLDHQALNVDVGHLQGRELWWERSNKRWVEPAAIDEAWYFDTAAMWEIGD